MVGLHRRGIIASVIASVALVVSACAPASTDSGLSSESEAYLDAVGEVSDDFGTVMASVDQRMQQTYGTREALLTAIADAGIPGAARTARQTAVALSPPVEFEADHKAWIDYRAAMVVLADELTIALENRDLLAALAVNDAMLRLVSSIELNASRDFCLAFSSGSFGEVCVAGDELPGGQYGLDAHEALRRFTLATQGFFDFPADLSPEERAQRLNKVQSYIEMALKDTGETMEQLEPTPKFEDDNVAFVRYFDRQYLTAVAITAANAERDNTEVLRLFDELGVIGDQLSDSLSDAYQPIAAPFFGGGKLSLIVTVLMTTSS